MHILWDELKRQANLHKHKMDFAALTPDFFEDAVVLPTRSGDRDGLVCWDRHGGDPYPLRTRGGFCDLDAAREQARKECPMKEFKEGLGFTQDDWDAVDSPELTEEQLGQMRPFAEVYPDLADSIRRARGRPPVAAPKRQISLRLDPDVIEKFKATGKGWQARINDVLKAAKLD